VQSPTTVRRLTDDASLRLSGSRCFSHGVGVEQDDEHRYARKLAYFLKTPLAAEMFTANLIYSTKPHFHYEINISCSIPSSIKIKTLLPFNINSLFL
jgi:hypothetical protein